jgi:hypothetical protein
MGGSISLSNHNGTGGGDEPEIVGKEKSGAVSGLPNIMLKDAYGAIVDIDTPLTVSIHYTTGRTVVPTITGAPAGYNYLKWEVHKDDPEDDPVAMLVTVGPGPTLYTICPVVIPLGLGTVTVSVQNCTSKGVLGTLTASFKVVVRPTYSVGGTIFLAQNENPDKGLLKDAVVQLKDGGTVVAITSPSASNGAYRFDYIPNGTYTLAVSLAGYESGTITDIEVSSGHVTGKDLTLEPAGPPESVP